MLSSCDQATKPDDNCMVPSMSEHDPANPRVDAYFSVDVETDGPIPGPYSMLSFAIVYAGSFDGNRFVKPSIYEKIFYRELKPISTEFQEEALQVNGLDRSALMQIGVDPQHALDDATEWVKAIAGTASPVLVAYPLSFDWTWLYWYFVRFSKSGSPFSHSRCFDIKTAIAVKGGLTVAGAGRSKVAEFLKSSSRHTHHAIDDAIEQAEIFANVFEWDGVHGRAGKPR